MMIKTNRAFTLIELLVVIGIIGLLAGMLMPALASAKRKANSVKCLNNIRQLSLSATLYANDQNEEFPRRRLLTNSWVATLQPYYKDPKVLKCPSDRWLEWRSYMINGWNDYWQFHLSDTDYRRVMTYVYSHGMKQTAVPLPSETILFGEKRQNSRHVHMDFGQKNGNDRQEVAQNMHGVPGSTGGGSNFAFVDGSVRLLPYLGSVKPVNLWAVTDQWRNAPVQLP
jgi:prepilin-type N-terminal cleavage/methylation domain-containing protein/prepilin-type processing-associated H-X9-DG protein